MKKLSPQALHIGYALMMLTCLFVVSACSQKGTDKTSIPSALEISSWKSYRHPNYDIVIKYPPDWVIENISCELCFQDTDGRQSIRFFYEPVETGSTWQKDSQWFSNTTSSLILIGEREVLSTTYIQSDPQSYYVEDLSTPLFDGGAYVKLSLTGCPRIQKETCVAVLYAMEQSMIFPTRPSTTWQTYIDDLYGFSFIHPPGTEVRRFIDGENGVVSGHSMISITSGTQGGSWYTFSFYKKSPNESLARWYNQLSEGAIASGPGPRKIIEQGMYYGYRGLKTQKYDAYILYLEKDNFIVGLSFDNKDFRSPDADHKTFVESIRLK